MNDLGLVSVLPARLLLALAALALGFLLALRRSAGGVLVAGYLALLITALYGLPAFLGGEVNENVTWRHAGIVDHIVRHGSVDGTIDAYFNWPGFFILSGFVEEATGVGDVLDVANWAPLFFNFLYLAPLLVIFGAVTRDRRIVWLAVGIFYLANWVGQDYFAPQALTYFFFLVLLALLLQWFASEPAPGGWSARIAGVLPIARRSGAVDRVAVAQDRSPSEGDRRGPLARAALLLITVLIFAATVPTHQLTPFAALMSVGLLVAVRRCSARGLPALMAVMIVSWLSFMAVAYLNGHLEGMLEGIGDLGGTTSENVSGRVTGSTGHQFVVRLRLVMTAGIWALAAVGALWRLRRGHRDGTFIALAVAPFPLVGLQSYGGEMLLRVYLFSLPFVAFFVAALLVPLLEQRSVRGGAWRTVAIACAGLLLLASFMVARYGNQRAEVFSPNEVRAVERLYELAPPGAQLVAGSENLPWKAQGYDRYEYEVVTELPAWAPVARGAKDPSSVVADVARFMRKHPDGPAFLIVSRSQRRDLDLLGPAPPGSLARFERSVDRSERFRLVYENRHARIWKLRAGRVAA